MTAEDAELSWSHLEAELDVPMPDASPGGDEA